MTTFRAANPKQSFPLLEEKILHFWRTHRIFDRSLEKNATGDVFSFFEGPPTANGKPGVHHVLARVFKDVIPRYKSMRGFFVPRKAGWDCHGLPVEVEVEKKLGLTGKQQIESYGVAAFNAACKESVLRYINDWDELTERIGFWVNTDDAYRTLDNDYIESCWSLLSTLSKQQLLQKDYKIVKHCPRCETSLAEAEASQGMKDDVEDPSVTIKFQLKPDQLLPFAGHTSMDVPTFFLVWTTTPWTLGANVAVALHPTSSYALAQRTTEDTSERFLLLESQVPTILGKEAHILAVTPGNTLAALRYEPLYAPFRTTVQEASQADTRYAYVSITDDSVDPSEGTGVVHIAPAYGDLEVGKKHGLPVFFSVGLDGKMLDRTNKWSHLFFKEADPLIVRDLKDRGLLFRNDRTRHSYPFCWRCDTPLMYFAKESWYIRTTARKDDLIQANQSIQWIPEHIRDGRFGDWLKNNVDWAISRERYWATPLPLWSCVSCGEQEWIDSVDTLEKRVQRHLRQDQDFDLHRPYVDHLVWPCTKQGCGGQMQRTKEVLDCWFDSGAMPYAQHHMPFENRSSFVKSFPADFICEGVDQTRGWFYTLHALAVLTQNQPAYKACIALGHILDEKGRKMAKRLGNTVDPWLILNAEGADALRYYLLAASQPGQPRRFSQQLVRQGLRQFLLTLWNCYSFFTTYAEAEWEKLGKAPIPFADRPMIDQWILGRLHQQIDYVTQCLESYDITSALRAISDFVDDLSNWYIRRNRDRFWSAIDAIDSPAEQFKRAAYQTLHECLVLVSQLLAPFLPFVSEELWQHLARPVNAAAPESVHLSNWPVSDPNIRLATKSLTQEMGAVLQVVNLGRSARVDHAIKLRQPLLGVNIQAPNEEAKQNLQRFEREIKEELNVETIHWESMDAQLLHHTLRPNLPKLGKKLGTQMKAVQQMLATATESTKSEWVGLLSKNQPLVITLDQGQVTLQPDEILLTSQSKPGLAAKAENGWVVALQTDISPQLYEIGIAREVIRCINDLRKKAQCHVAEWVNIGFSSTQPALFDIVMRHTDLIASEVLGRLDPALLDPCNAQSDLDLDEGTLTLTLKKNP